jgi:hypothetical protein
MLKANNSTVKNKRSKSTEAKDEKQVGNGRVFDLNDDQFKADDDDGNFGKIKELRITN